MKKNCKKQIKKTLEYKKKIKKKGDKLYVKWNDIVIYLNAGFIKMILYKNESILS